MPDKHKGLKFLATLNGNGRAAVETFFQENTGNPVTFDAIFSKFLSYLFTDSAGGWLKERGQNFQGLKVPPIASYATFKSFPAQLDGELMPYSVVAVDLPQALPPTAIVELNAVPRGLPGSCGREATLLWKPINLTRIAVYSVGCEHHSLDDKIAFSLRVLDKPLPTAPSPRKITH
jgi:hypothetical protein